MSTNLFQQVIFGVYEVLADILPGFVLLTTILFFYDFTLPSVIPTSLYAVFFVFLAFIIGQVVHCIASEIEGYILRWKYGGYPSTLFIGDGDDTFPQYFKDSIRQQLNLEYGTPLDSEPQHVFDLCYTYVTQNSLSDRVLIFFNMYTFSRNMILTVFIEGVFLALMSYVKNNAPLCLISSLVIISLYFFYRRFIRYAESFAKEVFRSYFIDKVGRIVHET